MLVALPSIPAATHAERLPQKNKEAGLRRTMQLAMLSLALLAAPSGSESGPGSSRQRSIFCSGASSCEVDGRAGVLDAPPPLPLPAGASDSCTVEQRTDLGRAEFERAYRGRRPVVLRGAAAQWAALGRWADGAAVAGRAADAELAWDEAGVVAQSGRGRERITARELWARSKAEGANCSGASSQGYAFDNGGYLFHSGLVTDLRDGLSTLVTLPRVPSADGELAGRPLALQLFASIGGRCTGLPWHQHDEAWNAQIVGRKHWLLFSSLDTERMSPADIAVSSKAKGLAEWLRNAKPRMETRPQECTLEPGDVIYLPGQLFHATLNVDNWTVAVAGQTNIPWTEEQELHVRAARALRAMDWPGAARIYAKLARDGAGAAIRLSASSPLTLGQLYLAKLAATAPCAEADAARAKLVQPLRRFSDATFAERCGTRAAADDGCHVLNVIEIAGVKRDSACCRAANAKLADVVAGLEAVQWQPGGRGTILKLPAVTEAEVQRAHDELCNSAKLSACKASTIASVSAAREHAGLDCSFNVCA